MSESNNLTREILNFLYKNGIFCWRVSTTGIFDRAKGIYRPGGKRGVSDILAVLPPTGRLLAVEVKIGKDKLSPEQEGFLANVVHAGGLSFVAKDLDSFKEWWYHVIKI